MPDQKSNKRTTHLVIHGPRAPVIPLRANHIGQTGEFSLLSPLQGIPSQCLATHAGLRIGPSLDQNHRRVGVGKAALEDDGVSQLVSVNVGIVPYLRLMPVLGTLIATQA